jgi:hypothetical protein
LYFSIFLSPSAIFFVIISCLDFFLVFLVVEERKLGGTMLLGNALVEGSTDTEGRSLGLRVGTSDGSMEIEGRWLGLCVGTPDGSTEIDGSWEGKVDTDGCPDGRAETVGTKDGNWVGTWVGMPDGSMEMDGSWEGKADTEGNSDGRAETEGTKDGTWVGALDYNIARDKEGMRI